MAGDNSTGHVFDEDLVEMNNPLPLWWAILFVITVLFAFAYVLRLPGARQLARKSRLEQPGRARRRRSARREGDRQGLRGLRRHADRGAQPRQARDGERQRLFINNCAACHGSDARGSKGFPNLTDGDWLHGGSPEKIEETITLGRIGVMPPLAAAVGSAQDVHDVARYVLSLSGSSSDSLAAYSGKKKFGHLRRLPRRRRQGQPGDRRAQPDRRHLAARLRRGCDRRHDHAGQDQRHAGAARPPHAGPDPRRREPTSGASRMASGSPIASGHGHAPDRR